MITLSRLKTIPLIQLHHAVLILAILAHARAEAAETSFRGCLVRVEDGSVYLQISEHKYYRFHIDSTTRFRKGNKETDVTDIARFVIGDVVEVSTERYGMSLSAADLTFVSSPSASEYKLSTGSMLASTPHTLLGTTPLQNHRESQDRATLFDMKLPRGSQSAREPRLSQEWQPRQR